MEDIDMILATGGGCVYKWVWVAVSMVVPKRGRRATSHQACPRAICVTEALHLQPLGPHLA